MSKLDTEHREKISSAQFAFPKQRKEPLEDASHVRNAVARFDQVEGVSDADRDEAWKRIKEAGKKYGSKSMKRVGANSEKVRHQKDGQRKIRDDLFGYPAKRAAPVFTQPGSTADG
jgi:hypothetical protein